MTSKTFECNKRGQDYFADINKNYPLMLIPLLVIFAPNILITLMLPADKSKTVFNALTFVFFALPLAFNLLRGLITMKVSIVRDLKFTDEGLVLETYWMLLNKPKAHKIDFNNFKSGIETDVMSEGNVGEVIYIKSGWRKYYVAQGFFDNYDEIRPLLKID